MHYFKPACFKIELTKKCSNSSFLPWSGTVTVPAFDGCLYCLWLPFWRLKNHPSASIMSIISLTFFLMAYIVSKCKDSKCANYKNNSDYWLLLNALSVLPAPCPKPFSLSPFPVKPYRMVRLRGFSLLSFDFFPEDQLLGFAHGTVIISSPFSF